MAGLPTCPIYVARGPRRGFGGREPGFDVIGMGVSDNSDDAWLKAVVEAVERYCFAWSHDPAMVIRHAYHEVEKVALPLDAFRFHTDRQYRARPTLRSPGRHDPIDWTWAYSLTRETFVLVPAMLAYPSVGLKPPNNITGSLSSTGVACHTSLDAALLAGLLEVVERDAVMLHWLHRRSPRRVLLEGRGSYEVARLVARHFDLPDFEFTLLDITADAAIPVICCVARSDRPDRPAYVFGAACRTDPAASARKALFETAQVLSGLHGLKRDARSSLAEDEVRHIWDHACFYAASTNAARIAFLTESDDRVQLGGIAGCGTGHVSQDLAVCVDRLAAIDREVLVVELTTPDVGRCGFRTVKVIVPGMIDLNGDARIPQLGLDRVHQAAAALGWPARSPDRLNLAPCPLS